MSSLLKINNIFMRSFLVLLVAFMLLISVMLLVGVNAVFAEYNTSENGKGNCEEKNLEDETVAIKDGGDQYLDLTKVVYEALTGDPNLKPGGKEYGQAVSRQTPRTDFGSMIGKGLAISKAAREVNGSLRGNGNGNNGNGNRN